MIISASRRTDIPAFYSDWFFNRIKEGYLYVRNPMYQENVSKISLNPEVIDCIVFWTKNAKPMLARLSELEPYNYYFQYTLNGYETDIEPVMGMNLNDKIDTFIQLSEAIGSNKVIWRYDPIFLSNKYDKEFHLKTFKFICEKLNGHTFRCVTSFLDLYDKVKRKELNINDFDETEIRSLVSEMVKIASSYNICIETCAEKIDLEAEGVKHGHCIDKEFIEELIGYKITGSKDKSQRAECGCMESIDIGVYDTCRYGCKYCYALNNSKKLKDNLSLYDVNSPFLCSISRVTDLITERKMKSLKRKR